MLVLYDLDKTSLYCPFALWLDTSPLKVILPSKLFFSLYSFVYILEMMFGQFKINNEMYLRAKAYNNQPDVKQAVITARHHTWMTRLHTYLVFKELMNTMVLVCVATGESGLTKAEVVDYLFGEQLDEDERIVVYDDNEKELETYDVDFGNRVTLFKVDFDGKTETIDAY